MSRKTEIKDQRLRDQRARYFKDQVLANMAIIEKIKTANLGSPQLFHEHYPEIEEEFWAAHDAKDLHKLLAIHNKLCHLVDELRKTIKH